MGNSAFKTVLIMRLIFNELSFYPLCNSISEAEERFLQLVKTFKRATARFNFKKIIFQKDLHNVEVINGSNFFEVIELLKNKDLKKILFSYLTPPYLDDFSESDLDQFYTSDFVISDENCPTNEIPVGLPLAFITNKLAISLNSDNYWKKTIIILNRLGEKASESEVYNICLIGDLDLEDIINWAENALIDIKTEEQLILYLNYFKFQVSFKEGFFDELMNWKTSETKIFKYILTLMKDVQLHPFSGGIGHTENLKSRGKEASKRITNKYPDGDRLSYSITNDVLLFISCKGHYKFH